MGKKKVTIFLDPCAGAKQHFKNRFTPTNSQLFILNKTTNPVIQSGDGFALLNWFKKIFRSPTTRKIWKATKRIGQHVLPAAEKTLLQEINRTKKGKDFSDMYKKGKNIGKMIYHSGIHKDLKKIKGGSLNINDPMFSIGNGIKLVGNGTRIAGSGTRIVGNGMRIAGSGTKRKNDPLVKALSKNNKLEKTTIKKINSAIVKQYMPHMIENLKKMGFKQQKKFTPNKKKMMKKRLDSIAKKQSGGWIGTALSVASMIPLGIELASTVVPMITSLFTKGKGKQIGSGDKNELNALIGKDIAKMLIHEQKGDGLGSVLAKAGKSAFKILKKILPVVFRVGKSLAPGIERAAIGEISRTKKGKQLTDIYNKSKKIAKSGYNIYKGTI